MGTSLVRLLEDTFQDQRQLGGSAWVCDSRLHGLKDKEEELENAMDPQKPPESPRSSSAQRSDWTSTVH